MKMITRIFNVSVAILLVVCLGWQSQPVRALELGLQPLLPLPVISGSTGVPGTTLSYFDGEAKTATADGSGNYSFSVSDGFAGTVTPSKTGYVVVFTPLSIDYSSTPVTTDQTAQNYTPDTSWWTISGSAGAPGTTLSYNDGSPETVTADGSGNYSLLVPDNFVSTITPSQAGYTFSPVSIDYSSTPVTANLTGQDYAATPITYSISGNAGVAGATLSYTDGTPQTATADGNGDYSFTVSYNWPGTVTPSKTGYTFSPVGIDYSSTPVTADLTGQDYTATPITYTISGNAGVAGATLSYTDGTPQTATADGNGDYSFTVSYNWPGTVTPSKTGYTFSPASIDYSSTPVTADLTGQDYTATPITYTISGNAGVAGAILSYTDGTPKTATADGSGNYSFMVSYQWSGTVTPSKATSTATYIFTPANIGYNTVSADQSAQNYTATLTTAVPTPMNPTGIISDTTPTYQWTRIPAATQYEYQLFKGATLVYTKTVLASACPVGSCSNTPVTVLGDAVYLWKVRAMVSGAWRSFSVSKAFTLKTIPTPQLPSGAITDTTPTYRWARITGATHYQYQLFKGAAVVYTKLVPASVCVGLTCSATPPTVLGDAVYKWKVRAAVSGMWRPFSLFKVFTLATIPTPQLPSGTVVNTTPTYRWARITGATLYQYELWQGATLVYTKNVPASACAGLTCSNTPPTALGVAVYKWRVRAVVSGAWRPFSLFKIFTIPLINGNLESGNAGWVPYSTHGWQIITTSFPGSVTAHSGSYAAWLGGDWNDISYVQQQVIVSPSTPYLVYWHWIASADLCGYDFGGVIVNGSVVESYTLCTATETGQWVPRSLNLSAYAGQSITLQIRAETDSSLNSNLFIDDVSFQATAAKLTLQPVGPNLDELTLQGKLGILPQGDILEGFTQQRIFLPIAQPK